MGVNLNRRAIVLSNGQIEAIPRCVLARSTWEPELEVVVRGENVVRSLSLEFSFTSPDIQESGPEYGPICQLELALSLLRPGFFGWDGVTPGVISTVDQHANGLQLALTLPRARPDLPFALARALVGFAPATGMRSLRIVELGAELYHPIRSRALDDWRPNMPSLPYPFKRSGHESSSPWTLEANFHGLLSKEDRARLLDLCLAYVGIMRLGLLPGEGWIPCARAELARAEDSLPDQWAFDLVEVEAHNTAIAPLLEALAVLKLDTTLANVELNCGFG